MKRMPERPDIWAAMLSWLANHRNEAGYSVLAIVMSLLATSRNRKAKFTDRLSGAAMCGILCFFIKPTLTAIWAAMGWSFPAELCWPVSAAVGYYGVDAIFQAVRKKVGLIEDKRGGSDADQQ
ncbi:phage holin, lambda family [Rahnella variigena]|uniref:phage holin, lambda family n=1 Tax=Rahnella variigena TaxID=574964 RepID=UPI0028DAFA36|nr:phage holin, lambda family [Rahnella variigena]